MLVPYLPLTQCSLVAQDGLIDLDQVMAWCLMAPSHYLIQCWIVRRIHGNIICVFSWCAHAFNHNIYLKAAVSFNRNHQLTTTMIVCLQSTCCVLNQKFCGTKEAVQFGKCTWNSFHTHSWSVQQFLFLSISFVQSFWNCMQSIAVLCKISHGSTAQRWVNQILKDWMVFRWTGCI